MEIHQFLPSLSYGDAIAYHVLEFRRLLRQRGPSEIFYDNVHPRMTKEGSHYWAYSSRRSALRDNNLLLYHLAIGSPLAQFLQSRPERLVVYSHNITPGEFFAPYDPVHVEELEEGRRQMRAIAGKTVLGLAASEFSRKELEEAGFNQTAVLPLLIDFSRYDRDPDKRTLQWIQRTKRTGPDVLFVGRIAPNKRQEDLVKLMYVYQRHFGNGGRLFLVGAHHPHTDAYSRTVSGYVDELGVQGVKLVGAVSFSELLSYYKGCDVFVSMSEHEGFGMPLLEAMHLELPVVAFGAPAVASTVGDAGIVFYEKDLAAFAAAVDRIHRDAGARKALVDAGRLRSSEFSVERVAPRALELLELLQ